MVLDEMRKLRESMKNTKAFAIAASIGVVALVGASAYLVLAGRGSSSECGESRIVGGTAQIGGPFELVDGAAATVADKDVIDKPSLIYFGFTFCPDVCPLDNARNAAAVDLLSERGLDVGAIFISIDPERDTPDVVREYAGLFHPEMVGLTGSAKQVADAAKAFRVYFKKNGDDEYYLMDHSSFTYLVFPGPEVVEFFRRDHTAEQIAETAACYIEEIGVA